MSIFNVIKARLLGLSQPRQPNMEYAIEGFYPIAMMRHNNIDIDLPKLAATKGLQLLNEGRSTSECLSAQWGGLIGIGADMQMVRFYLERYNETVSCMGITLEQIKAIPAETKWKVAAVSVLQLTLSNDNAEYERFLRIIDA